MKELKKILKIFTNNNKAFIGILILLFLVLLAICAPLLTSYNPIEITGKPSTPPSYDHILGTTAMGRDIWAQLLYGARTSMFIGFLAGFIAMCLSIVIGVSAGYFGGLVDDIISTIINVVMVIPNLALLMVLAAFLGQVSPVAIGIIIGFTSWAWSARILRALTLSIKSKDFVQSAEVMGEKKSMIIFAEILPNILSILASGFIGAIIYAVMTEASLEFIGLGDPLSNTWGIMLYNAQNSSAFRLGAWWEVMTPAVALGMLGISLALINFAIDEISNPKLRSQKMVAVWRKKQEIIKRQHQKT